MNTSMFNDPWLPKETSFKPICINNALIDSKVAEFITPSGVWDLDKIKRVVVYFDIDSVRSILIHKDLNDKLMWHYDRTREYSVKSSYKLFMKIKLDGISSSSSSMSHVWNNLWKLKIPSKIKHFCWKALNDSIPNKMNLYRRGIGNETTCLMCNFPYENSDHTLFECNRAKELWRSTYNNVFLDVDFNGSFVDR